MMPARCISSPGEKAFAAFEARFGTDAGFEVMERIADAHWNRGGEGVTFFDIHQHNACNHTLSGTIKHAGEMFGFIIESGDRNGTVIQAWGDPEDVGVYVPEPPIIYTFVPRDEGIAERRPAMFSVYLAWREQNWFTEKARSYNYDKYFAPGGKTEKHYRDWAESKGLRIVDEEEAARIICAGRTVLDKTGREGR